MDIKEGRADGERKMMYSIRYPFDKEFMNFLSKLGYSKRVLIRWGIHQARRMLYSSVESNERSLKHCKKPESIKRATRDLNRSREILKQFEKYWEEVRYNQT